MVFLSGHIRAGRGALHKVTAPVFDREVVERQSADEGIPAAIPPPIDFGATATLRIDVGQQVGRGQCRTDGQGDEISAGIQRNSRGLLNGITRQRPAAGLSAFEEKARARSQSKVVEGQAANIGTPAAVEPAIDFRAVAALRRDVD